MKRLHQAFTYLDTSLSFMCIVIIWLINGSAPDTIYRVALVLCIVHLIIMHKLRARKKTRHGPTTRQVKSASTHTTKFNTTLIISGEKGIVK